MYIIHLILLSAMLSLSHALSFVSEPSLVRINDTSWRITFEVSESTDVEVAIVSLPDSTIVRRLAAGVLGSNPPAPFAANSLSQTIAWDNRDDLGNSVLGGSYGVRVRAGMSTALDDMAGDDPYTFGPGIMGLAVDPNDGSVFVFGQTHARATTVRQYDNEGNYVRTIHPFPAGVPATDLIGYGINIWSDGTAQPRTAYPQGGALGNKVLAEPSSTMAPFIRDNDLYLLGRFRETMLDYSRLKTDSRCAAGAAPMPFVTNRSIREYYTGGPKYLTLSPDAKYFLLSGIYETNSAQTSATDTGFWQDGRVYRVDAATGAATALIQLDSVPLLWADRKSTIGPTGSWGWTMAAIHGTAMDDSGHIFICDRWHGQIGVYDTTGAFLGAIGVTNPDVVACNSKTGELYVLTRDVTGTSGYHNSISVSILKFPTWRNNPAPSAELRNIVTHGNNDQVQLGLYTGGTRPRLWFASHGAFDLAISFSKLQNSVWAIDDLGDSLKVVYSMSDRATAPTIGFERLKVDPRTETVYFNDSWDGIYKICDWSSPEVVRCSTSAGRPLLGGDLTISPAGKLYVRACEGSRPNTFTGPLLRYTLDYKHAPAPFANSGTNVLTPIIHSRYGNGYGDRGLAVSNRDRVAVHAATHWDVWTMPGGGYFIGMFGDSSTIIKASDSARVDSTVCGTLVRPLTYYAGGLDFDTKGFLYFGMAYRPAGVPVTPGFENDNQYLFKTGSVIRIDPAVRCSTSGADATFNYGDARVARVYGAGSMKVYPGLAAYSGAFNECACRTPRFEVDPYDRLFIPNAFESRVAVVDNEGNAITSFGQYGNVDSRGPAIALAYPEGVTASDNYIYVADLTNMRIVRVKMNFELENMHLPEATVTTTAGTRPAATTLAVAPNPFNPAISITLSGALSKGATVKVYDMAGKMMTDLTRRMTLGRVTWNAQGFASGMYVVSAQKGTLRLVKKILYSK